MKKIIVLFAFLLILLSVFSFRSDITQPSPEGFFLRFDKIGYSFGQTEIMSGPIYDIFGYFNGTIRFFPEKNTVLNLNAVYYDPFIAPSYFGMQRPGNYTIGIYLASLYIHNNIAPMMDNLVFRTHVEINDFGVYLNIQEQSGIFNALYLKGFEQIGFGLTKDLEAFVSVEGGGIIDLRIFNKNISDTSEIEKVFNEIKKQTIFVMGRGGLKWYSGDLFGVELGYRINLIKGNLRFLNINTASDLFYNAIEFYRFTNEQTGNPSNFDVNIPFITTDYYLSFTGQF